MRTLDDALFEENGLTEQRRITEIRLGIQAKIPYPGDETAYLRKGLVMVIEAISNDYPQIKEHPAYIEVMQWNKTVESIKAEVSKTIGQK